jgi:transketolase N-terminal domain/subunit
VTQTTNFALGWKASSVRSHDMDGITSELNTRADPTAPIGIFHVAMKCD